MKVSVPSSLEVGGVTYRILTDDEKALRQEGNYGQTRVSELEIAVSLSTSPERQQHTFLHECLHAIDAEYCDSKGMTEDVTDAVASGLLQVLKQLGIEIVLEDTCRPSQKHMRGGCER